MTKATPRQAEAIRLRVARDAVRANAITRNGVSLRTAWAMHLNLPENAPVEDIIAGIDGLIAELER